MTDTSLGGSEEVNWKETLPEDIRETTLIKETKSITDLAKQAVNSQKMIGNSIKLPDNEEGWDDVYGKLGRPETPDKYNIDMENPVYKSFADVAHQAGLNQSQVDKLLAFEQGLGQDAATKSELAQAQAMESLKENWGMATDKNIDLAKRGIMEFGGEDFAKFLEESGLGNDPRMVQFGYKIAERFTEDSSEGKGVRNLMKTPEEAKKEIAQIMADPSDLYNVANKIGHKERVEEVQQLFKMAYPEG